METPCDDLHLIALQWTGWEDDGTCPSEEHESRVRCEDAADDDGDGLVSLTLFEPNPMEYLVIVDGPDGEEANFTIETACP